ncbi:hypothetical protein CYY_009697 [Polysphondylium violaceum]|uniref:Uncharacterized protein n=1 Tax=Polysphondylium violaceum TaxID=133409 RepID=A0A8J4UVS6_9MYCE|nr:hypothetical protein CYY_009697 [Polysphondylium violaceum]
MKIYLFILFFTLFFIQYAFSDGGVTVGYNTCSGACSNCPGDVIKNEKSMTDFKIPSYPETVKLLDVTLSYHEGNKTIFRSGGFWGTNEYIAYPINDKDSLDDYGNAQCTKFDGSRNKDNTCYGLIFCNSKSSESSGKGTGNNSSKTTISLVAILLLSLSALLFI